MCNTFYGTSQFSVIFYECSVKPVFVLFLFVLLLYVPSQQLWSLRDGQFT